MYFGTKTRIEGKNLTGHDMAGEYSVGCQPRRYSRSMKACILIACLILIIPSMVRYGIGYDYIPYMPYIKWYLNNGNLINWSGVDPNWGLGIRLSISFISLITKDPKYVYALWSFLSLSLAFRSIIKFSSNPFISFVAFALLGYYFMSMNMMRQFFAMAILMNALPYLLSDKPRAFLKYAIITVVASLFHSSALLMLPLFFVFRLKVKPKNLPAILLIEVAFLFIFQNILKVIIESSQYSSYLSGHYSNVDPNSTLTIIVFFILALSFFSLRNKRYSKRVGVLLVITVLAAGLLLSGYFLQSIFFRVIYYLSIFWVFLLPELLSGIENKSERVLLIMISLAIGCAFSGLTCLDNSCFPYQTFFNI